MRVGIGILSYNRPRSLTQCLNSLFGNLDYPVQVGVSFDLWNDEFASIAANYPIWAITGSRSGIPHANNRLIQFFDGYDAIFLVQDDVRFLRPEWLERYLSGLDVIPYLSFFDPYYPQDPNKPRHFRVNYFARRRRIVRQGVGFWLCHKSPQGAFQAIGRACVEQVGYFDTGFGVYGFEHHDYWLRTCNAGICPSECFYDIEQSAQLLKIDWAQPPSLDEEAQSISSQQSKRRRHALFVSSEVGFQRVKVAEPDTDVQVLGRGPQYVETCLPKKTTRDLLGREYWVYPKRVPVLMCHVVSDAPGDRYAVPPALLKEHLELLTEHFRFVTASQAYTVWRENGQFPHDVALLTFDDGYQDFLSIAPVLDDLGIKATIFVLAQWVGRENTWDRGAFRRRKHLSWAELGEVAAVGHEVGSHTLSHYRLTTLPERKIAREVIDSKAAIESRLGQPVRAISYPFGSVNGEVISVVQNHYDVGFTVEHGGMFDWDKGRYAVRRIAIGAHEDPRGLLSRISAYMMQAPESEPVWHPTAGNTHEPRRS